MLVDVEEWGQVIIIGMLTRYARTQFVNPNAVNNNKKTEEQHGSGDENDIELKLKGNEVTLDQDHRLLLRNTKPLLQSRNASVSPLADNFKIMYNAPLPTGCHGCGTTLLPPSSFIRTYSGWKISYSFIAIASGDTNTSSQLRCINVCEQKGMFP